MKLKHGDMVFTDRGTSYVVFNKWYKFKRYYVAQDIDEFIKNRSDYSKCKKWVTSTNSDIDFKRDGITVVVRKYLFGLFEKEFSN